jgi:fructosamine-3-kinase
VERALQAALERELGSAVRESRVLGGGDINHTYRVALADGRTLFVKAQTLSLPALFAREAEGLGWLRAAGTLRVPRVIASSDDDGAAFLALELIESGPRARLRRAARPRACGIASLWRV